MTVSMENKTPHTVMIELGGDRTEIKSGMKIRADCKADRLDFNCYINCDSEFKTMKFPKFVVLHYNFSLSTYYDLLLKRDEAKISFVIKEVKGDHLETYKFLDVDGDFFEILTKDFKVKDEEKAKLQLAGYQKREDRASKYVKVYDVLQSICYVGVPGGILFFGIWYLTNLWMALYVTVPVAVVGVLVGLFIKYILNKFVKKLDKLAGTENDLYVDTNSYFQKEYILNIMNKRMSS